MSRSPLLMLTMTMLLACRSVEDVAGAAPPRWSATLTAPLSALQGSSRTGEGFARVAHAAVTSDGDLLAVRAPVAVPGPTIIFDGLNDATRSRSGRVDPGWLVDGTQPLLARMTTEGRLRLNLLGAEVAYDVQVEAGQPWWHDTIWQVPEGAPGRGLVRLMDWPGGSILDVYGTGSPLPRWTRGPSGDEEGLRIGAVLTTPDGDRVIVVAEHGTKQAWLEARRLSDGSRLWARSLDSEWPLGGALGALAAIDPERPVFAVVLADRARCEDCARVEIRSSLDGDLLSSFQLPDVSAFRIAVAPGVRLGMLGNSLWFFHYELRRSGSLTTTRDSCAMEVYNLDTGRRSETSPTLCPETNDIAMLHLPRSIMQVSGGEFLVLRVASASSLVVERYARLLIGGR